MSKVVTKRASRTMKAAKLSTTTPKNEESMNDETGFVFERPTVSTQAKSELAKAAGFEDKTSTEPSNTWTKPQLSKKEKMSAKREKFRSGLIMPGEKVKNKPVSSLNTMSSLKDVLGSIDLDTSTKSKSFVMTNSNKKKLKADEEKFHLVLQHQAYRANPLATMKEHLQNEMVIAAIKEDELKKLNTKTQKKKVKKQTNLLKK